MPRDPTDRALSCVSSRIALCALLSVLACHPGLAAAPSVARPANPPAAAVTTANVAVLTSDQVLQVLDRTVDWYRTLGTQQQWSSQPSDLLILYGNQQTANQVLALAFDLARANAELLSSEASAAHADTGSSQASTEVQQKTLTDQRQSIQAELNSVQAQARGRANRSELDAKASELQGELAMINARLNLVNQMSVFIDAGDSRRAAADALKARIDAIAASVPGQMPVAVAAQQATAASTSTRPATGPLTWTPAAGAQGGLWQMITDTLSLERKRRSIVEIDQSTAALQQMLGQLRGVPTDHLDALTRQSDALAQRADQAHGPELRAVRAQLDTLAWLFQQTSAMLVPLIKQGVLLDQYRHNLSSWHEIVGRQYHEALAALSVRLAVLAGVLALILAGGEVWRRMVLRYTADLRRRQQLLLIRKLTLSALVLQIIGLTFFTQLGSFATFAGLITAGVAVAMQSVLTCIVGYFLLIGKYGLRVGDRVQINNVTGEILDLGLIRLHLMELGAEGKLGATGRVVAIPNSIVFQATGGLFRQLPGVSLVWHEVVVSLPSDRDYARFKSQLMPLLADALHEVQEAIRQQSRVIRETASTAVSISEPQVQLRLTGGSAEVVIRYPVQVERAAEIDEKVSEAIRGLLAQKAI